VFPGSFRIRLWDHAAGSTPLPLPDRRMWTAALICGAMFAIFAGVGWMTVRTMSGHSGGDVFDLVFLLFQGFWLLGWSVGVLILGLLTVFLSFYGESARLQNGRLIYVPRLGPVKIIIEYDLAKVRNVRLASVGSPGNVQLRFDYDGGSNTLGDTMPRADAETLVKAINSAVAAAGPVIDVPNTAPVATGRNASRPKPAWAVPLPPEGPPASEAPPPSLMSPSGLALIGANLIPLAGVLFLGWDLSSVMILFWAESGVIAFYTVLKMAIVGRLAAIFAVPFFVGHFGGFMAIHFLFIYMFFVRGVNAAGVAPGAREALLGIFRPLWLSVAALFISHGISFVDNFLGRREYEDTTMKALMTAPYNRIIVMQLALIFGGWIILLLKSPVPALALLIVLKTALDFTAHRKEHGQS